MSEESRERIQDRSDEATTGWTHERFHEPTDDHVADSGNGHDSEPEREHDCGRDRPQSWEHGHDHERGRERLRDHDRDGVDLSSPAARRAAHHRLACALAACPHAMDVQCSAPGEAAAQPYAETEVLASVTLRGTVHPSVGAIVADSALELATVRDANSPDYKRVVVR